MKLFLDDDSAIHKLVSSQYKIVPDKLLRTGAYSSSPSEYILSSNLIGNPNFF